MNFIIGGSFNPPTKGHLKIANYLIKNCNAKKVIFLPVGSDYNKKGLINDVHRFNMLNTFVNNKIIIDNYEMKNKYKGTYDTLTNLKKKYSNFHFVMGSDNFNDLHNWNDFDKLLNEFKIIVLNRNNCKNKNNDVKVECKNITFLNEFNYDISSTEFRETLNFDLLTFEVENYIKNNNLFEVE